MGGAIRFGSEVAEQRPWEPVGTLWGGVWGKETLPHFSPREIEFLVSLRKSIGPHLVQSRVPTPCAAQQQWGPGPEPVSGRSWPGWPLRSSLTHVSPRMGTGHAGVPPNPCLKTLLTAVFIILGKLGTSNAHQQGVLRCSCRDENWGPCVWLMCEIVPGVFLNEEKKIPTKQRNPTEFPDSASVCVRVRVCVDLRGKGWGERSRLIFYSRLFCPDGILFGYHERALLFNFFSYAF